MTEVATFSLDDISVSMTENAIGYARKQLASDTHAKGIVLGVKKSGCSGFKYDLQLMREVAGNEKTFQVADDVTLFVTSEALPYVNGTEIDYATQGLNSTMVFNNPNAKDECGCGESFNVWWLEPVCPVSVASALGIACKRIANTKQRIEISSMERRMVVAERDVPARLVPAGTKIIIPSGSFVTLTQALGGNYTVIHNGNMARVDGTDAGALGLLAETLEFPEAQGDSIREEDVWMALRTIYDPEIPVNLVDLGLIYTVNIDQAAKTVRVDMTLTAPACGMGPVLVSDVKYRAALVPNVKDVVVELVFDPPWSREMMSEEAQLETGMFF